MGAGLGALNPKGEQRHRTHAADEHGKNQHRFAAGPQPRRDAGGKPRCAVRRHLLKQQAQEIRLRLQNTEREGTAAHNDQAHQGDGGSLCQ